MPDLTDNVEISGINSEVSHSIFQLLFKGENSMFKVIGIVSLLAVASNAQWWNPSPESTTAANNNPQVISSAKLKTRESSEYETQRDIRMCNSLDLKSTRKKLESVNRWIEN